MKIDRLKIYNKCGGHCAYCGKNIEFKQMQIDHVIPKARQYRIMDKDLNDEDNLLPTCRSCNHYKRDYDLEQFRHSIMTLHERAASHYIGKVALDYGIIKLKPFDGKFYFEK